MNCVYAGADSIMAHSERFNKQARAIGREIFEFAYTAQPKIWQQAWWLDLAMLPPDWVV